MSFNGFKKTEPCVVARNALLLRKKIYSTEEYFEKHAQILKAHLTNRKYSVKTLDSAIQKACHTSRFQTLTYSNIRLNPRSPISTTTFHPCLPDIKSTFKNFSKVTLLTITTIWR